MVMNVKQRRLVLASMLLVIAAWFAVFLSADRTSAPMIHDRPLHFDADRALEATGEFVTRHPRRVLGSLESRQSSGFFRQRLQPLGYEVSYMHFNATVASRAEVGRNVLALRQGEKPQILAVVAHYDTAAPVFQGAMDNGSGIGVLVELGRVFAEEPLRHSLLLVATDGEEWGMLGAADLAQSYPGRDRIAAALSVDYVAAGGAAALYLEEVGLHRGYSSAWLRDLSRTAAGLEGLEVLEPHGLVEHLERTFLVSVTDQGPLLAGGIPAINIGSVSADAALESKIYHSSEDTIEKLEASAFGKVGRAAERILRTLDGRPAMSRDTAGPFRVIDNRYLSATSVGALHVSAFAPLLLAGIFLMSRNCRRLSLAQAGREATVLAGIMLPFLAAYYGIVLLTRTGHIPQYSLYPPGRRDPGLENPDPTVLLTLLVVVLLSGTVAWFAVRHLSRSLGRPDYAASRTMTASVLACIVGLGLVYNSYWTATFFLLPAWIWVTLERPRGSPARLMNFALLLISIVPWLAVTVYCASLLGIGWKVIWFGLLALSTGLFRPATYLLSAAMAAVGLRFLALQFTGSAD